MTRRPNELPLVEWAFAGRPMDGDRSGDTHVAVSHPDGVLLAVIDGLGHGAEAAEAAELAATTLERHVGEPVLRLVERCHDAIRRTRGVAMSVVWIDAAREVLTWVGVGNVEVDLVRARGGAAMRGEALALRGGVVGYRLPSLRTAEQPLFPGDLLVFATDGVEQGCTAGIVPTGHLQDLADTILRSHGRATDDAHVLVARFVGRTE